MRDARIERLLGGYASNTLTTAERKSLFEAALDDQELFNALQDEEALRDLLADADSRQAIARAMQQSSPKREKPWFAQGWTWGVAGAGALACAVLLVVNWPSPEYQPRLNAELRSPEHAAVQQRSITQSVPSVPKRLPRAAPPKAVAVHDAAAPVSPQQPEAVADQAIQIQAPAAALAPQLARSEAFPAAKRMEVRAIPYSLMKRSADGQFAPMHSGELLKAGDLVRVVVRAPADGSLTVSEQSSGGIQLSLTVLQNETYSFPDTPIEVSGVRVLRLVLTTGEPQGKLATNVIIAPGKPSDGR